MHKARKPFRVFETGLAVSIFRDKSTRTRFSFASAVNALGLGLSELDEEKSQIAHGETVRETANMISFLTEVIGIRDDMYLGEGNTYMREVGQAVQEGFEKGVLHQRPSVINLQCDVDHPTQAMADLLQLKQPFRVAGEAAREEDRDDLGLFAQLRQAAFGAAGHHRPDDALRHGGVAGLPGGLRADSRGGGAGKAEQPQERRQVRGGLQHGGGVQGRGRGLSRSRGRRIR